MKSKSLSKSAGEEASDANTKGAMATEPVHAAEEEDEEEEEEEEKEEEEGEDVVKEKTPVQKPVPVCFISVMFMLNATYSHLMFCFCC